MDCIKALKDNVFKKVAPPGAWLVMLSDTAYLRHADLEDEVLMKLYLGSSGHFCKKGDPLYAFKDIIHVELISKEHGLIDRLDLPFKNYDKGSSYCVYNGYWMKDREKPVIADDADFLIKALASEICNFCTLYGLEY